ncbi:hypothetical protein IU468_28585 [Nocardia farcinica]|uniref:hypothetical protein n=1 Tax=Nocardia farcinica TaxID=37329 RepID=UPI001894408F|nr:hypothetical protein [Nocardia farcinica]MBF6260219.1 hypothetical protein [Nocardia farcinica]
MADKLMKLVEGCGSGYGGGWSGYGLIRAASGAKRVGSVAMRVERRVAMAVARVSRISRRRASPSRVESPRRVGRLHFLRKDEVCEFEEVPAGVA